MHIVNTVSVHHHHMKRHLPPFLAYCLAICVVGAELGVSFAELSHFRLMEASCSRSFLCVSFFVDEPC